MLLHKSTIQKKNYTSCCLRAVKADSLPYFGSYCSPHSDVREGVSYQIKTKELISFQINSLII